MANGEGALFMARVRRWPGAVPPAALLLRRALPLQPPSRASCTPRPLQVGTEEELAEALAAAAGPERDSLVFIEALIHRDDCSAELLEWGSRVSAANSRPPRAG